MPFFHPLRTSPASLGIAYPLIQVETPSHLLPLLLLLPSVLRRRIRVARPARGERAEDAMIDVSVANVLAKLAVSRLLP